MYRSLLAVALLVIAAPAYAADLPVKAPPTVVAVPYVCNLANCSGFYAGANLIETGSNFDVLSSGATPASNSLALGGQFGYQLWNGQWFLGAEGDFDYGITQTGAVPGAGNSALWAVGGLAKIGYGLSGLFGSAATGNATPTLPSQLANALIAPYAILGVWDRPWGAGFASGAGVQALIASNITLSVDYIHVNYNNASINPNVNQQTEDMVRVGIDRHF
jgi:opacity protein-like surface antigen